MDRHSIPREDLPPAVDDSHVAQVHLSEEDVHADAQITDDGRLNIKVGGKKEDIDRLLKPILEDAELSQPPAYSEPAVVSPEQGFVFPTKLNIVIQIVGSRGDVQPFIALGKVLHGHGHRVRIATHPTFKGFVEDNGLEFYSIGGDPAELMAFMVKNPGLLPGMESLRAGDVGKRRKEMGEIIEGCWRSCIDPGDGTNDDFMGNMQTHAAPFVADAIIANPPSFAHIHCAEKLRVPLHMMFTMPWSPTRAFPHPLANIQTAESVNEGSKNYFSFGVVETMTWQGLGDLINTFRVKRLGLGDIDPTFAPGMISRLRIPHTYAWSPALIPKPGDWATHLSVSGFMFLPLASNYTPPEDLAAFLAAGPPPVYIGFGSIVVAKPDEMTQLIMKAVSKTGVRALVSKGWGRLGANDLSLPENVFMLGTMAAGISAGKPTIIAPFFGDQPFWGAMVARAGAGPEPIPHKKLTAERLAAAITEALQPSMTERAVELGALIKKETGAETAASQFYSYLPAQKMHCTVSTGRLAVWRVAKTNVPLSALAAAVLVREGAFQLDDLRLYGPSQYNTDQGAIDPISAVTRVTYRMFSDLVTGVGDISRGMYKSYGSNFEKSLTPSPAVGGVPELDLGEPHARQGRAVLLDKTDRDDTLAPPLLSAKQDSKPSRTNMGLKKLAAVPLKTTTELTAGIAQGLHNAPKLYGDKTVREPDRITRWQSGLKAASKELGLGVYDGFKGVVTHPMQGYKEEGTRGLYKGIGKGLGGVLIKPIAGVGGLFGFTFSGIYKETQKKYGKTVDGYLRAVRITQGLDESKSATEEECAQIVRAWNNIKLS